MNERRTVALLMLAAVLICLPMILFNEVPGNDTAGVYSRLMREVGAGRWDRAFYHLVPPLMPVAGGIFVALGCSAFTAAKITSTVFFALTILPLYGLIRQIRDRQIALVACLLYLLCSPIIQYAGEGVLATTKMFFLVLAVYASLRFYKQPDWTSALLSAVAAAGLTLARGEGIIFAGIAWLIMAATLLRPPEMPPARPRRRLMLLAATTGFVVLALPWILYEYQATGWLVTDYKQAILIQKLTEKKNSPTPGQKKQLRADGRPKPRKRQLKAERNSTVRQVLRGMIWPYWLLILPVLAVLAKRRKMTTAEGIIVGWIVAHTLFFILFGQLTGVVQKRYFVAAFPLALGWAAIPTLAAWNWLHKKQPVLAAAIVGILSVVLLWRGTADARPERDPEKRKEDQAILEISRWLREETPRIMSPSQKPLPKTNEQYQNGRVPVVMSVYPAPVLLADADWAYPKDRRVLYTPESLRRKCDQQRVNFIILNRPMMLMAPFLADPNARPRDFVALHDRWQNAEEPYTVLGYAPNLIPGAENKWKIYK